MSTKKTKRQLIFDSIIEDDSRYKTEEYLSSKIGHLEMTEDQFDEIVFETFLQSALKTMKSKPKINDSILVDAYENYWIKEKGDYDEEKLEEWNNNPDADFIDRCYQSGYDSFYYGSRSEGDELTLVLFYEMNHPDDRYHWHRSMEGQTLSLYFHFYFILMLETGKFKTLEEFKQLFFIDEKKYKQIIRDIIYLDKLEQFCERGTIYDKVCAFL
jgi:hypothetical protein